MGAYLQCGRNKVYRHHLIVEMAFIFVHTEIYTENTIARSMCQFMVNRLSQTPSL